MVKYLVTILLIGSISEAEVKKCKPTSGVNVQGAISGSDLSKREVHSLVDNESISRCSLVPSLGKVTCDVYKVDKMVEDPHVKIKKYYYYKGQLNVQVFPDGGYIEDNGRGTIYFGSCK